MTSFTEKFGPDQQRHLAEAYYAGYDSETRDTRGRSAAELSRSGLKYGLSASDIETAFHQGADDAQMGNDPKDTYGPRPETNISVRRQS